MIGDTTKPKTLSPFLTGERVYLRPLEKDDMCYIRTWFNDAEVRRLIGEVKPMNQVEADRYFDHICNDQDRIWFGIALRENDRLIGETGLLRIYYPWRTADLSIIIGDKNAWGRGYGTQAINLLLDYAFGALALHRIAIGVVGSNKRALAFYEKVGFQREGVQRDGYFIDHKFSDFVMMSILEDEYRARHQA